MCSRLPGKEELGELSEVIPLISVLVSTLLVATPNTSVIVLTEERMGMGSEVRGLAEQGMLKSCPG